MMPAVAVKTGGEPGEMLVRVGSPAVIPVMRGYYNRPDETARTIKDGWIHTGDVAKADEDGYLYIVDRKKDMVPQWRFQYLHERGGAGASAKPRCSRCRGGWGARCCLWRSGRGLHRTGARKRSHACLGCRARPQSGRRLQEPKYVFIVDALPRNSLGKVLKRELRDQATDLVDSAQGLEKSA